MQTPKLANLQQAAYNYARYHELAPDDLLGLKRLTKVCAGVEDEGCREAAERVTREQENKETVKH